MRAETAGIARSSNDGIAKGIRRRMAIDSDAVGQTCQSAALLPNKVRSIGLILSRGMDLLNQRYARLRFDWFASLALVSLPLPLPSLSRSA